MKKSVMFITTLVFLVSSFQSAFGLEITSDKYYYDTNSESITVSYVWLDQLKITYQPPVEAINGKEQADALPMLWRFRTDPEDQGLKAGWNKEPNANTEPWQDIRTDVVWTEQGITYHGVAWYSTEITVPASADGKLWLLFGMLDGEADIWIDGQPAGKLLLSPWDKPKGVDITSLVKPGEKSQLVIRVQKAHAAAGIGRGVKLMSSPEDKEDVSLSQITGSTAPGHCLIEVKKSLDDIALLSEKIAIKKDEFYTKHLDIKKLPQGRYLLIGKFFTDDNKLAGKQISVFFKNEMGYQPDFKEQNKIDIRDDGIILLNDKPFCPFYASGSVKPLPALKNAFNVRWGESGPIDRPLLCINPGLPGLTKKDNDVFVHMPSEEEVHRLITSNILNHCNTPYLFHWWLAYEANIPMYRNVTTDGSTRLVRLDNRNELFKVHKLIKALDPNHLTTIQIDTPSILEEYVGISDVLEIASGEGEKPGTHLSSYSIDLIPNLIDNVDSIRKRLKGQPFFFWIGGSMPLPECRDAEEIRGGTYLTLMHGAAGIIFHMGHESIPPSDTRHLSVYSGLGKEIDTFFPILTSQNQVPELDISLNEPSIDYCVRRYNNKTYLFAVNTSSESVDGEITIGNRKARLSKINLLFENRTIKANGNKFKDTFTPYEPHIYEF